MRWCNTSAYIMEFQLICRQRTELLNANLINIHSSEIANHWFTHKLLFVHTSKIQGRDKRHINSWLWFAVNKKKELDKSNSSNCGWLDEIKCASAVGRAHASLLYLLGSSVQRQKVIETMLLDVQHKRLTKLWLGYRASKVSHMQLALRSTILAVCSAQQPVFSV